MSSRRSLLHSGLYSASGRRRAARLKTTVASACILVQCCYPRCLKITSGPQARLCNWVEFSARQLAGICGNHRASTVGDDCRSVHASGCSCHPLGLNLLCGMRWLRAMRLCGRWRHVRGVASRILILCQRLARRFKLRNRLCCRVLQAHVITLRTTLPAILRCCRIYMLRAECCM